MVKGLGDFKKHISSYYITQIHSMVIKNHEQNGIKLHEKHILTTRYPTPESFNLHLQKPLENG
jgi:hypothetical protein